MSGQGGSSGSNRQGFPGAFTLGAASGVVASPCTAPVLGVVLTYVTTTQDVLRGGALLFAFIPGLGLLLLIVGTFSGVLAALPKPGNWMNHLKKGLGLIMILLGEYYPLRARSCSRTTGQETGRRPRRNRGQTGLLANFRNAKKEQQPCYEKRFPFSAVSFSSRQRCIRFPPPRRRPPPSSWRPWREIR